MDLLENNSSNIFVGPDYDHSNHLLDKDFAKVFEPFRRVQKILGSCRVDIKNRYVSSPTMFQKSYTALCIIMMTIALLKLIKSFYNFMIISSDNHKMFHLWTGGIVLVLIAFAGCIIAARFSDNEGNINLYIQMQEIDRLMTTNQNINSMLFKRNQRIAYFLATAFVVVFILSCVLAGHQIGFFELFGSVYTLATFVMELSCCVTHINFFYTKVCLVNCYIMNHYTRERCSVEALSKGTTPSYRYLNKSAEKQDFETTDTDLYIKEIFRGYTLFKEQYRFQIFIFCTTVVIWTLFTFENGIFALQSNDTIKVLFILEFVFLFILSFVFVLLLLLLCVESEAFLREVRRTKHLSILVMCLYADGPLRTRAKNMLKLIEETPPSFSVYGMWRLDAQLLLDVFNIVTNLIVTIIQFTFL